MYPSDGSRSSSSALVQNRPIVSAKNKSAAFWRTNLALATAYGQLGQREAASNAVRELLAVGPDFPVVAREELAKWWDPELIEHLIDGLRKAGLQISSV